jgi:glyoxalase family protein
MQVGGIHHVTAIAGDPQANVDFYTAVLGLRLVKVTVNYDDPHTYHLYYGDERGRPGTLLTFFPWPGAPRGRQGTGQMTVTAFAIPHKALGFWTRRLKAHHVEFTGPTDRFEETVVSFHDPDGLLLELVTVPGGREARPSPERAIPAEHAIERFRGVTIAVEGYERSAGLLTATLGAREVDSKGDRFRYAVGEADAQAFIDLRCLPSGPRGRVAVGTVHHLAWRTPDEGTHKAWHFEIARLGYDVTPIINRMYFQSIYFREPGGVLFEIATDSPGFAVDEPEGELGGRLTLPRWLEAKRPELLQALPALRGPEGRKYP